jgi:hypothetical protein
MAARKSRTKTKAARPTTVAAYLASLTPEKRTVIEEARAFVHRHMPKGYAEFMNWGVRLDMGKCCLHFKELGDLELISVAKVIAMSTPKEYLAYYKRVKGLA